RPTVGPRRAYRGAGGGGAGARARGHDRPPRRPPALDAGAGRPGGVPRGGHDRRHGQPPPPDGVRACIPRHPQPGGRRRAAHAVEGGGMTAPVTPDTWRGTAAEAVDDVTGGLAGFLRVRSRRLLGSLVRPHRRAVVVLSVIVVVQNLAAMAGPY